MPARADAFVAACALDVAAFKPGNVSQESPGHGMRAEDFLVSAEVAAPFLCAPGRPVGERIYLAVAATRAAVACNTNLGILLLTAPLLLAAETGRPGASLATRLRGVLADLSLADADWAFRAIALAAPGGLGHAEAHDVHAAADVTLLAAMQAAAARDRIAHQYATGFRDVFEIGLPALSAGRRRWRDDSRALVAVYLAFLAAFPDSHVARKRGEDTAERVRRQAAECLAATRAAVDWAAVRPGLADLDRRLKADGINPGTSADLCVATWLADRLGAAPAHPDNRSGPVPERPETPV
ncbi:hypothetical protein EZJ19_13565 [Parasulfuritortus cantonensis]|uniref:Uncharacterized protein n=2 Tax=Parasulfuritortus cantonensis TaxID=2528202 RepID=A0A4R1B7Y5_9PROT|nr:hypothetical protein EZJ19_13565 [Parasulfuritortus cantonensis]